MGLALGAKSAERGYEVLTGVMRSDAILLIGVFGTVESLADELFAGVQASRQKIADNYLSLKAYAVTAETKINNYVIKGKGRNLSSLGDLLVSIAALSAVKVKKAEGIGAGAGEVPAIFSAKMVKVDDSVNKINGLANEYTGVAAAVRARWS